MINNQFTIIYNGRQIPAPSNLIYSDTDTPLRNNYCPEAAIPAHSNRKTCSQLTLCERSLSPTQTIQTVGLSESNCNQSVKVITPFNNTDNVSIIYPTTTAGEKKSAATDSPFPEITEESGSSKHIFRCSEKGCSKSYSKKNSLICHTRRAHKKIFNFKCTKCDKKFVTGIDLRRHQTTHTGARDYHCNLCNKDFAQACSLKLHLNQVHKQD